MQTTHGIRFVMSPRGDALGLPAGDYYAIPTAKVEADARALWAYRVIERATLIAGSYSGDMARHEALLAEHAAKLIEKDPALGLDDGT